MNYAKHPDITIRREHFGGMAFNKSNGKLLELDREACLLLELTDGQTSLRNIARRIEGELNTQVSIAQIHHTTDVLRRHSFLVKCDNAKSSPINAELWPKNTQQLSAPESVHLALTHRCNYQCQSCYVDDTVNREMTTADVKSLINEMAEIKVFQLAIGGGEPFVRNDLVEIVSYANLSGIVPNITTNGSLITSKIAKELSGNVGQIQISVNGHNRELHEMARQNGSFNAVLKAMEIIREQRIPFGMNVLLCKNNFKEIENIIEFAEKQHCRTVNFLRAKPSKQDDSWYKKAALSSNEYIFAASTLRKALSKYPNMRITVDCALSFLMNQETPDKLQKRGVYGCTATKRFLSIYPDGNVYPCSFFSLPEYHGGNVVKDDLKKIWREGFQEFREIGNHLNGKCSLCKNRDFCMGCRAIVLHETGNVYSGDNGCLGICAFETFL